jgi:hypothetical protein
MNTNSGIFSLNSLILLAVYTAVTIVAQLLGGGISNRGTMMLARFKIDNRINNVMGLILGIFTVYLLNDLDVGLFWWAPVSALILVLSV